MKRSAFAAICVGVLMFLVAGMQEARAQTDLPQTTTLIVKVAPGVSPADADATIRRHGGTPKTSVARLGMYVVEVAEADAEAIKKSLEEDPAVARVEENRSRKLSAIPSDALFAGQWALPKMAWTEVYGNVSTTAHVDVAILDTGIDAAHPDLIGAIGPGTSFIDDSNGRTDTNGHGTWVAGIVAGRTNNLDGIAGVAYSNVQILPVKVLDASGLGQDIDIIQGVLWAVDHGASVILMAFSNEGFSQSLQDAIDYAWSRNIVLVAAVGNEGTNTPNFPAGDKGVIGVSATDQNDELAPSSNYGSSVFLAAPGVDIVSTYKDGGYVSWSGSSASAAMVAGAAALMRAVDGTLTNGVVVSRLARSADPAGTQEQTGNGRVQIARALADNTMDEIQPAGTPPVGDGGPFVGPYRAAACTVSGVSVVSQSPALAAPGDTINYTNINLTKSNGNCSGTWSITWTGGTPAGTTTAFLPATFTGSGTSKLTTLTITTTAGSTPTGTREFKVSAGGSDTGGTVTSNNFSFALDKASQTISFGALANKTYGAADFGVSATASSGLPVSFTASGNCNVLSATVHIVAAGSCTITAKQGGDATYYAAPDESRTFSIARADVSVVISPYAVGYDGNPHTATGSAIGVFSEALAGLDLSGTTHTNAGSYPTDPWTFTDVTGNYNNAAGTASNSIGKADATITVTGFSGTYDGNSHGVISSSAKGINNEDLTGLVIAATTYANVPGGNVHWTFTNTNYNDQSGDAAVTIGKADATILVTGFSGTYDGNSHGVISSSAKGINNEDLTGLVIAATTYVNVPGGNVHWTFMNTNYNDQSGDAAVTIGKADATILVTGFSGTYDGNSHGVISSSAKGINNEDLTGLVIAATTYANVPGGNVHWTFMNTNYNDQSGDAAVTIGKADATILVTGFSGTYDGNSHGVISSSAKGINNEDLTGLVIAATTYANVPGGNVHWTFTNTNYNDQSGDAAVTIGKADATILVTGFSGTYDGNSHGVISSSAKGINNEDLTGLVIAATTYTNVPGGNVHWTFTNTNYNDQSGDAAVTIGKADATILVTGFSGTYDGNSHGVISSSAKGINNEDLTGLVIAATTYTNVPGGNVHWTFTNTNYNDQGGDAAVTISKADATILVTGFSGTYDGNSHGVISSSAKGINNEDLTGLVIAATTYANVPGGNVHWTFTNTNYNDQSGDAAVTISKADATITVTGFSGTYDGNSHGVISSSAKGINNEDLTGLVIAATTYTNVPGGNVHWTFTNTNYNDQSGDAAVTIGKADATITVTGFSGTYDGNSHGVISSSAKGINNEDLTGLVIAATTYTNVPGGNVHWTFTNTNYNDQSGDAAVTIGKADATITVTGFSGTYDGNSHGVISSSAKGINNENLTGLVIAATTYTNVPGGNVHWTFTNTNYNDQSGDAPVTISVAPLTITANNKTKTYGTLVTFDTTTPSADFSVVGLAGGDTVNSITLTSAGAAAAATVVGSPYAITPSAAVGSGLNNYTIQYVAGQLTMRYGVCLQYDALKAHKKGSTIPIKINLCDGAGNNVSSAEVVVTATTILKLDSTASPFEAEDSGNANPDSNFRFAGGFYIFNLSLKNGFDKGTYRMSFVVNGQSDPNYSLGFDVK